ncbi:MAG: luciferase-like protein [Acidimicrobiia bacterium]|nr:luciferase-like protein [Acidimicrobiia bacterium]
MALVPSLSVLDVSPVPSGFTAADALANTVDLARHVEGLGFRRYWLAEHHNTAGIASSVPAIMINQVANSTRTIRVGAGGVMLPNHSPLSVAEAFRVLETLHPNRIDLGIGRAPGTDGMTAYALRRSREALAADDFPQQFGELLPWLNDAFPESHQFADVMATPAGSAAPPVYLLGSSGYSASAAAQMGLGFAFAHHINPGPAVATLQAYRDQFEPSADFKEPAGILALSAVVAETEEEAERLAASVDLMWLRIGQGERGPFPSIEEAQAYPYTGAERAQVRANRSRHAVGSAGRIAAYIHDLAADAGVDEVMVLTMVHDHEARKRSYQLLAEAMAAA